MPPPGYELNLVTFVDERRVVPVPMRLQLAHTNSARGEGDVDSAKRHAELREHPVTGEATTCPHFQIDRDGRAALLLPTNRRAIANSTGEDTQLKEGHPFFPWKDVPREQWPSRSRGDVSWWSIAFETADTGIDDDPEISAFTPIQAEMLAIGFAYNAVVWDQIRLVYPSDWFGPGSACHTDPFPFPHYTTKQGKTCPGPKKKQQVREHVLARAKEIVKAWRVDEPLPGKEDDTMIFIGRLDTNPNLVVVGDGVNARRVRASRVGDLEDALARNVGPVYRDPTKSDRPQVRSRADIPLLSAQDLLLFLGVELDESTPE